MEENENENISSSTKVANIKCEFTIWGTIELETGMVVSDRVEIGLKNG